MKIIATIARDKYLIEADHYEIGRIRGKYCEQNTLSVGEEILVSDLYDATREIVADDKLLTETAERVLKLVSALQKFGMVLGPIAQKLKDKQNP